MKRSLLVFGALAVLSSAAGSVCAEPSSTVPAERNATPEEALTATDASLLEALDAMLDAARRKPVSPARHPLPQSAVPTLADVPEHYDQLPPVTATVVVRSRAGKTLRQSTRLIARTPRRVYVRYEGQGQEWLFRRNAVDRRRMMGQLVDHREKTVLDFYEADLLNTHIVRGWAHVMTLGVSADCLGTMRLSGEWQEHHGIVFAHYVDTDAIEPRGPGFEVWWSASLCFTLENTPYDA
jgi:hypothetical protein